jgi:hypothetical protein
VKQPAIIATTKRFLLTVAINPQTAINSGQRFDFVVGGKHSFGKAYIRKSRAFREFVRMLCKRFRSLKKAKNKEKQRFSRRIDLAYGSARQPD